MESSVYPVILSGGVGSRLWPLSRKHYPKQFLRLVGDNTMLQKTAKRLEDLNSPIVVCNEAHRFIVGEQLNEIGIEPSSIILEPEGKNTAPAIALAAFEALKNNPEAILVVLPADHEIKDIDGFRASVNLAIESANAGHIVTFGIIPTSPETGFGYIEANGKDGLCSISSFREKPDQVTAIEFLKQGNYYWNSGMFVLPAQAFLNELKEFKPDMYRQVEAAYQKASFDMDFVRVDPAAFAKIEEDSIDYAVMEKTNLGKVLPINVGWDDLGSFSALLENLEKNECGNATSGDVWSQQTENCLVKTEGQFIATIGVKNLAIIATKDSILVADMDHIQNVKDVVTFLKENKRSEHLSHREVYRPWGSYDSVDSGERYQVKRISVKPGASLSLQMHHHRAEHWVVVSGTALVQRGEKEVMVSENQSIYIPLGEKHRLKNPGRLNLELIEVQSGSYLGEDDIVRYKDEYSRV